MPYRTIARTQLAWPWSMVVFRLVYGRWPNRAEAETLFRNVQRLPANYRAGFRSVVNLFDQQSHLTPFSMRLTEDDVRLVDYAGVKVAVDVTDPAISNDIQRGIYEPHLIAFFQHILRPGMKMLDIGANIGLFSLLAAKLVGKEGCVYSIEPRGENARLLLYSASVNRFDNIHLLPLAVGDSTGYTLYRTHIGANGGLVSKEETESGDRAILHPTAQVVPLARLDNLVDGPVDVIKIDIEGAEGMAMRGAQELIRTHRPIITSEASMEMLGRVSHMTLRDYLLVTRIQNYRQFVIGRMDGRLTEIRDLDQFLASWPDPCHIEDFALVPEEKLDALAQVERAT
jgi:FkbM family methyltransferase